MKTLSVKLFISVLLLGGEKVEERDLTSPNLSSSSSSKRRSSRRGDIDSV
jgi:hypothetical protein